MTFLGRASSKPVLPLREAAGFTDALIAALLVFKPIEDLRMGRGGGILQVTTTKLTYESEQFFLVKTLRFLKAFSSFIEF